MPELISFTETKDLTDFTVVIPSVSVGNVPQLTVDLLITTFHMKKLGTVWHPAIVPCVGSDPYGENPLEISTACELYASDSKKLAVIQIRSSLEVKLALNFFEDLQKAFSSLKIKNVLILSSAFDYEMRDVSMEKFYYVSNEYNHEVMNSNQIKCLEKSVNDKYILNGGGFGTKLYEVLSTNFKCTLLGKYVSEGDNRPDSIAMLQKLSNIMDQPIQISQVVFPSSWQYVFGGPPPVGIY